MNTKNVLSLVGIFCLCYDSLRVERITISLKIIGAIGFAVIFSLICLYSADYNHTVDYAYATYFVSFAVWIFGAYAVCKAIRMVHGEVNFKLITLYLTAVCFGQCVAAIMIDRIPAFQLLVDGTVRQGQEFLEEVDRLYGIGASLDNAGVRFSIVQLMIAALLVRDESIRGNSGRIVLLLLAFFTIALVGNMISRTTTTGLVASLLYIIFATGLLRLVIRFKYFKFFLTFIFVIAVVVGISIFLYHTDDSFYHNIRFAFEGFFNWVETGTWTTGSTEKLNREMWIWPEDTKTWIIGSGLFNNFIYSTDIGYCRFILYCGLVGFSFFALFFIYNAYVFARQNDRYALMFFFFLIMTFIIWLKVATDIFFIYALFYCLDGLDSRSAKQNRSVQHNPQLA
ncbi:hypothetical protein PQ465_18905 [Sphingobacterium oryzagri]|uniref:Uncharacterized protein n=1 Tax=Sphingobacterium oryzagri TaxID=3025669 RepID=A0ABY7WID5_9SPHI|nr:hypothetical protein [Sphingobacterium sp. KACC 22765]WDF68349.1 hypothetical protein PQ465_18905 [Sphingobacterium sp. KACC 22765]